VDVDNEALRRALEELRARFAPGGDESVAACRAQVASWREREPDSEESWRSLDFVELAILVAACARYGLKPYRRSRRGQTVFISAPAGFRTQVLRPQLETLVDLIRERVHFTVAELMERWAGAPLAEAQARPND
jgi:hypothetical protein